MRVWAQCGECGDAQEIRGIDTQEQALAVTYAFWARHDHPEPPARKPIRAKVKPAHADDPEADH